MGNFVSTAPSSIANALFTPVQQRVLGLLFGSPHRTFRSAELLALVDSGTGAAHRQLTRLTEAGLLVATRVGNQKHYRANERSPVFTELHGLIVKTVGLVDPLREALRPFEGQIRAAFVYGSVASGSARSASDVDVMIISDTLRYPDVMTALGPAEATLSRGVNPTLLTTPQWNRRREDDSFVSRVLTKPAVWLIGSEDAVE